MATNSMGTGVKLLNFTVPEAEAQAWGRLAFQRSVRSTGELLRRCTLRGLQQLAQEAAHQGDTVAAGEYHAAETAIGLSRLRYYGRMLLAVGFLAVAIWGDDDMVRARRDRGPRRLRDEGEQLV